MNLQELDCNKIVSGIVVGIAKLVLEEIRDRIKRCNDPKKPKKRKIRNNKKVEVK